MVDATPAVNSVAKLPFKVFLLNPHQPRRGFTQRCPLANVRQTDERYLNSDLRENPPAGV